jgi:hypothetical protein
MFKENLRSYTEDALEQRGVEVMTGEVVESVVPERVKLKSERSLRRTRSSGGPGCRGTRSSARSASSSIEGNRIGVDDDLRIPSHPEVFAVGDIAAITDAKTQQILPSSARSRSSRVRHAGETIARSGRRKETKPFDVPDKGTMATIGRGAAVVQMLGGKTMKGKKAQLAWGTVHLALLPTNQDRAKAVVDWAGAGLTHPALRPDQGRDLDSRHGAGLADPRVQPRRGAQPDGVHARLPHHPGVARRGAAGDDADRELPRLRRGDADALKLARRWSKAVAVTFAVGAVTGNRHLLRVRLLWPGVHRPLRRGLRRAVRDRGIFFFLEAIFIAIYIFGWKRLSRLDALLDGRAGRDHRLGGAFSVVAVNSWMNQPQGFSPTTGKVTSVEPLKVIFNPAVPYEVPHMILGGVSWSPGSSSPRSTRSGCCAGGATASTASGC